MVSRRSAAWATRSQRAALFFLRRFAAISVECFSWDRRRRGEYRSARSLPAGAGRPWPRACARISIDVERTIARVKRVQNIFSNMLSSFTGCALSRLRFALGLDFDVHLAARPAALEATAAVA